MSKNYDSVGFDAKPLRFGEESAADENWRRAGKEWPPVVQAEQAVEVTPSAETVLKVGYVGTLGEIE